MRDLVRLRLLRGADTVELAPFLVREHLPDELQWTGKLGPLTPEARARVDDVTRLIVEKLLIEPTEQLKALPDEETQAAYTGAINRLFKLHQDDEPLDAARGKTLKRP